MKQYTKTFYDIFKVSILLLLMILIMVGCKSNNSNGYTSSLNSEEEDDKVGYEGVWYLVEGMLSNLWNCVV